MGCGTTLEDRRTRMTKTHVIDKEREEIVRILEAFARVYPNRAVAFEMANGDTRSISVNVLVNEVRYKTGTGMRFLQLLLALAKRSKMNVVDFAKKFFDPKSYGCGCGKGSCGCGHDHGKSSCC